MNDSLSKIFIFAVGAAIGSAATWYFVKTKYERIAQEEIDSVKAAYATPKKQNDISETQDEEPQVRVMSEKPELRDYANKIEELGYVDDDSVALKGVKKMEHMYVIPPEEFDELGYETITLTFHGDGTLENSSGHDLGNAEEYFGIDVEDHFGEYEDDSVFIRDDQDRIDYEILRVEEE